jgi:ATP-dependent protease HslVU (ClpYQ) peptidase subunit
MTTIATDGRAMAADGRSCIADRVSGAHVQKMRRLKDGSVLGLAGNLADLEQMVDWFNGGEQGRKPKIDSQSDAIRLMPDGRLLHYTNALLPSPIDPPFAIGSGADFAIGAMDEGAPPKRAVERAIVRDPFSGGKITVLALK